MPENSILAKTEIIISDYNENKPAIFSNLSLTEALINVNNFSFSIRPTASDVTSLSAIIDFKKAVLGKNVELSFKNGDKLCHKFKGVIVEVSSLLVDNTYYEFAIRGTGIFSKVNELREYRSFYKKKLDAIIEEVFKDSRLKSLVKKSPQNSRELHYIVQYDQTAFAFMASLATRFGEWMYYDGENLNFGKKPEGEAIELVLPQDIGNLNISAHAVRPPSGMVGTDIFKSELVEATSKESAPDNDIIKSAETSGEAAVEESSRKLFVPTSFAQEVLTDKFKLEQQAILASSVFLTGRTRNPQLSVGKIIKIKDNADDAGKSYVLTQVVHSAGGADNYANSFTAVPVEVPVPPYTNPLLTPKANTQPAVVTDNEDDAKLARLKVKFPWMADDEKSPWISVLAPHAGKDKGFRFIPEKDDEVLVSFMNGDAEMPFVNGALYTNKNMPGIEEAGNHIKFIGSRTGRSILIDDQEGTLAISDGGNTKDKGKNLIRLTESDKGRSIKIVSGEDGDNHYAMILDYKEKNATFYCQAGGEAILNITFDAEKKQMYIFSKDDMNIKSEGSISIEAKKDIKLKAIGNITGKSRGNIKMVADGDAETTGLNVKVKASAKMAVEGSITEIKGAKLDLNGSGIASLQGGLVKIN